MDNLKEATLQSELRFKDLIINPCHRSVLINNNRIDLTTKEFDLLYFLAIHPGWAFTKSQIYETVWGEEYVCNQHAVENIIYNLRRKMAINSTSINYIQTLVGYGYKARTRRKSKCHSVRCAAKQGKPQCSPHGRCYRQDGRPGV